MPVECKSSFFFYMKLTYGFLSFILSKKPVIELIMNNNTLIKLSPRSNL